MARIGSRVEDLVKRGRREVLRELRVRLKWVLCAVRRSSAGYVDERRFLAHEVTRSAESQSCSVGCLSMNFQLARAHGWSEDEIVQASLVMGELSRMVGRGSVLRHPEWHARGLDGTLIFTGPINGKSLKLRKGLGVRPLKSRRTR